MSSQPEGTGSDGHVHLVDDEGRCTQCNDPVCQVCGTTIREKDTDMLCEDCFEQQVPALQAVRAIQQVLRDEWSAGFDDYTLRTIIDHLSDAGFNPNPLGLRRTPAERMRDALDQVKL
jgi:hypothetical protein